MSKRLGALSAAMIELLNKNPVLQDIMHADDSQQADEIKTETGFAAYFDRTKFVGLEQSDAVGGTSND